MQTRHFWLQKIEEAWKRRSILWLSGVRRVGKTTLGKLLPDIEYFDCELPRVRQQMQDPEEFLSNLQKKRLVIDEIHRLDNPSELLKIAADHFHSTKILATGSSTLGASAKFKDTLTGRKEELWLTPMMSEDLKDFKAPHLHKRFLRGGLPPFFLASEPQGREFQEWMDAYWAKDIQELFRVEKRHSFLKFTELLVIQSGGLFEATQFSRPCEVSRPTIQNYLSILEATFVVHCIRPFGKNPSREITAAPKVYFFDTGFFCYFKGWKELRPDDYGILWEHYVLNELHAQRQSRQIYYWRDKRQHEIDFVLTQKGGKSPTAVECKWSLNHFDPKNIKSFRNLYPHGKNYVVAHDVHRSFTRKYENRDVQFINLEGFIKDIRSTVI